MAIDKNPIISVNGMSVKCPSTFEWTQADVSSSSAGRTEDTVMHKDQIGQTVSLSLGWNGLQTNELHAVLKAFNEEYSTIVYTDPLHGDPSNNYRRTTEFYTGNRTTSMYNATLDRWSVASFNIIERDARK